MNELQNNDEISIWDIVNFLKEGWRWLAGGVLAGAVGAVGFIVLSPAQYEATAIIQPATVGMPATTTTTTTTKGAEVEPVVQTLERLKLPTFYSEALIEACRAPSAVSLASSVKASQVKGNSLIQVSFRADTVAAATACVNAVVERLATSQATLAAPMIKTLEEQVAIIRQQLNEAEAFQAQLEKRTVASPNDVSLLMLNALSKREEVARLQKLLTDQKVQLSAPLTQPLQLLEPVYAPDRAVFPKKLPTLAGGLLGGLVFGGLVFFVRRSGLRRPAA